MTEQAFNSYLKNCNWEWYASLGFRYLPSIDWAPTKLEYWNEDLCRWAKMQTAYVAVLNPSATGLRWDVLMLGSGADGRTLLDVDTPKGEEMWIWMEGGERRAWLEADIESLHHVDNDVWREIQRMMALCSPERRVFVVSDGKILSS